MNKNIYVDGMLKSVACAPEALTSVKETCAALVDID